MADVVVVLPEDQRGELKDPLGRVYTDTDALLEAATAPVVAVGDIVTYHLLQAGVHPDVALVDGRTEREAVDREITDAIEGFDRHLDVENPPATLTEPLLTALREGFAAGSTLLRVDGEEDLATLPAVLAAPDGASVVYGQPREGMVHVRVDAEARSHARELLGVLEGSPGRVPGLLGGE